MSVGAACPTGRATQNGIRAIARPGGSLAQPNAEASWDDLQPVDTLGLEVGFRLISLVDKAREGDLLARIKGVRKKFAQDVGFLPPPVHIRDNLELKPSMYRLTLRGAVVGEGEAYPGMWLAINPGGPCPQAIPPARSTLPERAVHVKAQSRLPRPYRTLNSRISRRLVFALYGNMCTSRLGASRVSRIDCWRQYLRMPPAPWREPRPLAFQPPIGSSRAE